MYCGKKYSWQREDPGSTIFQGQGQVTQLVVHMFVWVFGVDTQDKTFIFVLMAVDKLLCSKPHKIYTPTSFDLQTAYH